MSFSFHTMFQARPENAQDTELSMPENLQSVLPKPAQNSSNTMPASAPPLNAASPFGAPLFKFAQGEETHTAPLQPSPFTAARSASTSAPLTVADLLPLLPLEIARTGALPQEQPVAVSPQVLHEALRGGQAALPIFEIYRVCPALFLAPISPQDPRMIPLPTSKLPYLIAVTTQAAETTTLPAENASLFARSASTLDAPALTPPAAAPSEMMLPPRRQGPPPRLADVPGREIAAPQLALPRQPATNAQAFPMGALADRGPQMSEATHETPIQSLATSPFGQNPQPATPSDPVSSPWASSPFGQSSPAIPTGSPFGQVPAKSPFAQARASALTVDSPLGSLFGSKAVPTGEPAPDLPPSRGIQPLSMPVAEAPGTSTPLARICLANLLKGYTPAELGFDPIVVPAWITTALPMAKIHELAASEAPLAELGLLINGITNVGFRSVLNTARLDFQLRLPAEELQAAMAGSSAARPQSNLPNPGAVLPQVASSELGQNRMLFESLKTTPTEQLTPPETLADFSIPGIHSPFLAPTASLEQPSLLTPNFGTTVCRSAMQPSGFGMPAAALQPLAPKTMDPIAQAMPEPSFTFQPQPPPNQEQATFQSQLKPHLETNFQPRQPSLEATFKAPEQETQIFSFQPQSVNSIQTEVFKAPQAFLKQPEEHSRPTAPDSAVRFPMPETAFLTPERQQESADTQEGFTSEQLLGREPSFEQRWTAPAFTAAIASKDQSPTSESQLHQSPVIDGLQEATPRSLFTGITTQVGEPKARPNASKSTIGVQTDHTNPDQILLRALLDTDTELTPHKVLEMTCKLPGIAACVCIQGKQSISHIGADKPQAREFQRQAIDLAQHLRTLAPLIGIEGAETFTMNSGDRLMTFCFPEGSILGVLHDAEPTLGLRDKITLIARELSRMIH